MLGKIDKEMTYYPETKKILKDLNSYIDSVSNRLDHCGINPTSGGFLDGEEWINVFEGAMSGPAANTDKK